MIATQPMGRGRCARTRRGPARRPSACALPLPGAGEGAARARRGTSALVPPPAGPLRQEAPGGAGRGAAGGARCGRRDEAAAGAGVGQGVHPARLQRRHALPVPEQVPGRAGEPGEGRGGEGGGVPGPRPPPGGAEASGGAAGCRGPGVRSVPLGGHGNGRGKRVGGGRCRPSALRDPRGRPAQPRSVRAEQNGLGVCPGITPALWHRAERLGGRCARTRGASPGSSFGVVCAEGVSAPC